MFLKQFKCCMSYLRGSAISAPLLAMAVAHHLGREPLWEKAALFERVGLGPREKTVSFTCSSWCAFSLNRKSTDTHKPCIFFHPTWQLHHFCYLITVLMQACFDVYTTQSIWAFRNYFLGHLNISSISSLVCVLQAHPGRQKTRYYSFLH